MTISNVSFNVRFDLTGAPKLVLTDTTGSAPAGMVGIYTITQPDGYVRTGNISSPDTVAGGVFQYNLSPDSIGGPQCGNYTIKLTVTAPGYFSTDFTRTFAFSYAPVSLSLTKNFDIFTPNLSYSDGTNYSVAGYSTGAVTRSWLSNSTPTGNLTSSGVSINLAYQGQYYDAVYTTTLTSSLVYQHTTNAWLSVSESLAKTEVASACTPKPLDELVQMLESFRNGDIDCAGETPDFDRAQILYTHLIDMLRLLLAGGIGQPGVLKVYDDFLFLVRGNQTVPCNHTNQPIPAYDFSDYEVTPFTADAAYCATFGDNVNISYLINHQLNDVCVLAQVYEVATGQQVFADLVVVDPDNVYVTLLSVPTTNQYRIVVHTGLKGLQGPPGPGFPTGGTTGQYLKKQSNANFDTVWFTPEFVTSLTGEATGTGPGATAVTLSNSAIINKVLTGLSVSSGVITQTDSILTAFGKLQGTVSSLVGGVKYAGTWNAATNSPAITSSVGVQGTYYVVSTPGSTSINGITDWKMGDWIIFNGTVWEKVDNTDAVISVNGQTGAVSLTTTNIAEGTNLYYTDVRARAAISLTTTGNSGAATYVNGVLNIPQYQAALTNPVTGTGTTNYVPKFTASGTIGDSQIVDNGSAGVNVGTKLTLRTDGPFATAGNISSGTNSMAIGSTGGGLLFYANNVGVGTFLSNGDFGIGKSPTTKLDVNGNALMGGSFLANNSPFITGTNISATTNMAIGTSSGALQMFSGNAERMRLTSAGVLGVGTASPDAGTILHTARATSGTVATFGIQGLTINPRIRIDASEADNTVSFNTNYNGATSPAIRFLTTEIERMRITSAGRLLVGTTTEGTNTVDIAGTLRSTQDAFFATSSGNVGIGVANADTKLEVSASAITPATVSTYAVSLGNSTRQIMSLGTDANYGYIQTWGGRKLYLNNQGNDIVTNANVGIRTISPSSTLDVSGTMRSTQGANFATSSGSVGIGTETINAAAKMQINGNLHFEHADGREIRSNGTGTFRINNPADAGIVELNTGSTSGYVTRINVQGGFVNSGGAGSNIITMTTASNERMRLTAAGRLLVGTTTDAGATFQVAGTMSSTQGANFATTSGSVGIGGSALDKVTVIQDQNATTTLRIRNSDAGSSAYSQVAVNAFGNSWAMRMGSSAANSNALDFIVDAFGTPTSRMLITTAGNVGIGTTSPLSDALLQIGSFSGENILQIAGGTTGISSIHMGDGTGSARLSGFIQYMHTSDSMVFGTNQTEKVRITSTGNVGIGLTSPASILHVSSDASNIRKSNAAGTVYTELTNDGLIATGTDLTIFAPTGASLILSSGNGPAARFNANKNFLFGTTSDGGGATVMVHSNGTAPTSNVTDSYQIYSADVVAGNAAPHIRTENGNILKLYQETTAVGSATVASPGGGNTIKTDDTFDGYTIQQIAKALRNQGLLA